MQMLGSYLQLYVHWLLFIQPDTYSKNLTTFETYASHLLVQLLHNTTVGISDYGLSHLESFIT